MAQESSIPYFLNLNIRDWLTNEIDLSTEDNICLMDCYWGEGFVVELNDWMFEDEFREFDYRTGRVELDFERIENCQTWEKRDDFCVRLMFRVVLNRENVREIDWSIDCNSNREHAVEEDWKEKYSNWIDYVEDWDELMFETLKKIYCLVDAKENWMREREF